MTPVSDERLAELDQYFGEVVAENADQIWEDVLAAIIELRSLRRQIDICWRQEQGQRPGVSDELDP